MARADAALMGLVGKRLTYQQAPLSPLKHQNPPVSLWLDATVRRKRKVPPNIVELKGVSTDGETTTITFLAADGQQYSCIVSNTILPELAYHFQVTLLPKGQLGLMLTVTVVRISSDNAA